MPVPGNRKAQKQIEEVILTWPGLEARPHVFGGREYGLGTREIGHIHGDYLVDIPFPKKVRDELVAAGKVEAHHVLPESGWISFYLREDEDISTAIELLKLSYDLAARQKHLRSSEEE